MSDHHYSFPINFTRECLCICLAFKSVIWGLELKVAHKHEVKYVFLLLVSRGQIHLYEYLGFGINIPYCLNKLISISTMFSKPQIRFYFLDKLF